MGTVTYHEHRLHPSTSLAHRRYIQNARYGGIQWGDMGEEGEPGQGLPLVVLLTTRDVVDEELFSTYFDAMSS
jgi:hypothetical protein